MTAAEVLETCQRRGVRLWRDGDTLRVRAPKGVLSEAAAAALSAQKAALLPLLPAQEGVNGAGGAIVPPGPLSPVSGQSERFPSHSGEAFGPSPVASAGAAEWGPSTLVDTDPAQNPFCGYAAEDERGELIRRLYVAAIDGRMPTPAAPVSLCPGTTTDDPARWVILAFERLRAGRERFQSEGKSYAAYLANCEGDLLKFAAVAHWYETAALSADESDAA